MEETAQERRFEPRPYQTDARDAAFAEWSSGVQHTLAVMPTGTGKTAVAACVIDKAWNEYGRKTLFLAHRGHLVEQGDKVFQAYGLSAAIEKAELKANKAMFSPTVVVGSVQSMQGFRLEKNYPDRKQFGVIIVDEAHRVSAAMHQSILSYFQDYWHLGITATPDGAGNIGNTYTSKCYEMKMASAIKDGWLVPIESRTLAGRIDLRNIKTTGGDFNAGDLAERIGPHVEVLCRESINHIQDRNFVCFTPDVGSARAMAEVFTALGLNSKYVAGSSGKFGMPKEESKALLASYAKSEFQGIVCCDLLFEGWDDPKTSCVVNARPTRKRYRFVQAVGRGTRLCPEIGKSNCLVLDFDWMTDRSSRDLCSVIDLFPDDEDPKVLALAKQMIKKGGGDALEAIEKAKDRLFRPKTLGLRLTGATSDFKVITYDPVGATRITGVTLKGLDYNVRGDNPATERQARFLERFGVGHTNGLSKWGASKLIDKLVKDDSAGLPTFKQSVYLANNGMDLNQIRSMTRAEASKRIGEMKGPTNGSHQYQSVPR